MRRKNEPSAGPRLAVRYSERSDELGCRATTGFRNPRDSDFPSQREGLRGDPVRGIGLKTLVIIGTIDLTQRDHIHSHPGGKLTLVTVVRRGQ